VQFTGFAVGSCGPRLGPAESSRGRSPLAPVARDASLRAMDAVRHTHWIGGAALASQVGLGDELRSARAPFEGLGCWPLAGEYELGAALENLARGASCWSRKPASVRQEQVACWIADALAEWGEDGGAARLLGLPAERLVPDFERLQRSLDRGLAEPRSARLGVALVSVDWSELTEGLLRAVGSELQAGRAVLLLGDPRAPMLADRLHAALVRVGLPGELLAVLHGLPDELWGSLVSDARVGDLWCSAREPERMRAWRALGLQMQLPAPHLELLRAGRAFVRPGDNLRHSAQRILGSAFGHAESLHGQAAGQIGQVHCHPACFSELNALLLEELEAGELGSEPLVLIDRAAGQAHHERWMSGLDQGATLIAGGEDSSARKGGAIRRVLPTILTNVEPHMLSARSTLPLPVLCLLRAPLKKSKAGSRFRVA